MFLLGWLWLFELQCSMYCIQLQEYGHNVIKITHKIVIHSKLCAYFDAHDAVTVHGQIRVKYTAGCYLNTVLTIITRLLLHYALLIISWLATLCQFIEWREGERCSPLISSTLDLTCNFQSKQIFVITSNNRSFLLTNLLDL